MSILQAIVLGIVQGISEFLPVSSSGHLILIPQLFGWPDQGIVFDVAVHLATLCAVLYVFHEDVIRILKGLIGSGTREDAKRGWMILVATVPAVIVGLFLGDYFETVFRSASMVALSLAFWGLVLAIADQVNQSRKEKTTDVRRITWPAVIVAGLAQAIALIPGTSRSGITISAGLFMGLDRVTAARFSFLLGIPAIAGAGALTFAKAVSSHQVFDVVPMIIGFLAALFAGIFSIRWLLKLISKTSYVWFAVYRILIALLIFALI